MNVKAESSSASIVSQFRHQVNEPMKLLGRRKETRNDTSEPGVSFAPVPILQIEQRQRNNLLGSSRP